MTASALVSRLFRDLESHGVRYAVLRNYEQLPALDRDDASGSTTDIDLAIDSRDLDQWRTIATNAVREEGWDRLVECDHWRQSAVRHHHIEVFQFYRSSPSAFLQVDVFHGYLVLGLPLVDERGLLAGRILHKNGLLTRVDPVKEAAFKLLQVYGHLRTDPAEPKIARYRRKLARFADRPLLERFLRRHFSGLGVAAFDALVEGDFARFHRYMALAKAWFVAQFFLRHPVHAAWSILNRIREHRLRFATRQCGRVLRAYAPEERHRRLLRDVLESLAHANVIDGWLERRPGATALTRNERAIMEQGGLVIEWNDRASAQLDVPGLHECGDVSAAIVQFLAARHYALFCSETFCSPDVEEAIAR